MDVRHREAHNAAALLGWRTVYPNPVDLREPLRCQASQRPLVREHVVHPDSIEVLTCGGQPDGVGHIRRSRLELVRQHIPGRLAVAHELDHVAPELVRPHRLEDSASADKSPDAHRTTHLVSAERIEIDVEVIETDTQVRGALRPVTHHQCVGGPRDAHDVAHRIQRPHGIRHVVERDDLRARTHERAQRLEVDALIVREGANEERRAACDGELLPRDEVRMVLECGDDDLVTRPDVFMPPGGRHEVERLRGAAREDQAVRIRNTKELRNPRTRRVVAFRGAGREIVRAAMRIRIVPLIVIAHRVEHDTGLLGSGRRIQVVKPGVIDEERKIRATRDDHDVSSSGGMGTLDTSTRPSTARASNTGSGSSAG